MAVGMVRDAEETVRQATTRLGHLVFELSPPSLVSDGLAAALRQSLEQARVQFGLSYRLEDRLPDEPPAETRTIAYRIVQEALANVRKHARATSVEVALGEEEGGVYVRVRDDGQGFAEPEAPRSHLGHMGLTFMRERAEMAGGWLRIRSAPGAGTTVECWLPMSGPTAAAAEPRRAAETP